MFIAALFTIAKSWKQPKCPWTDEWIKKMWYVCVYSHTRTHTHTHTHTHTELSFQSAQCIFKELPHLVALKVKSSEWRVRALSFTNQPGQVRQCDPVVRPLPFKLELRAFSPDTAHLFFILGQCFSRSEEHTSELQSLA